MRNSLFKFLGHGMNSETENHNFNKYFCRDCGITPENILENKKIEVRGDDEDDYFFTEYKEEKEYFPEVLYQAIRNFFLDKERCLIEIKQYMYFRRLCLDGTEDLISHISEFSPKILVEKSEEV